MAAKRAAEPTEWITPGDGLGALLKAGRRPDEARVILFRGLQSESFLGRAQRIVSEYSDGIVTEHLDHAVPGQVWQRCPLPPYGHLFWLAGDIRVDPMPLPDGSVVMVHGEPTDLQFGYLPPIVTVTGFRIPLYAVMELGGVFNLSPGRGRRQGVGGFAKADAPLIAKMHRLLQSKKVNSVHAAAVQMAPKAAGAGEQEAKVRRLTERYKAAFPDSP